MTALITPPNWRTVAARSERLPQSSVMLRCTLQQHKTEDSRAIR